VSRYKKGNWSAQELERLKTLYPRRPVARVAELLHRSEESVRRRAGDVFGRPVKRGVWTADDDQQLRVSWGVLDASALSLVLARSESDVRDRAEQLRSQQRRGPWSRRESLLLKRLYGSRDDRDLEVCLSRTRGQIERMAGAMCLSKDKRFVAVAPGSSEKTRMPRWSKQEVSLLIALYPDRDNLEIARQLGRSVASVANKASQLRLRKSRQTLRAMGRQNVRARYEE